MSKLLSELAKGTWSGATAYTVGDIVDNDGSSYICIANSTNHEPPNVTYWALLANKGDQGIQGETGPQGIQGIPGTGEIPGGTTNNLVTINSSDQIQDSGVAVSSIPVKATGAEVDTGTDDAKYVTAKAIEDSDYVKVVSNDINIPTGGNVQVNSADPYRTIVIPAGSMSPTTTAGCASVATVEAGTNDVDYKVLDFDTTTVESAWVLFQMPNNWDGGTITFKPVWTAASGSGTVCFGLKGRAFADDDAIDQAYGTEQTSTDTLITAGDVHIGPESSAITLAGTPAGGQLVQLKVTRQTGSDTLGVDARLIGIRILYKIGAYSD